MNCRLAVLCLARKSQGNVGNRLRVVYVSFTCRLRVVYVSFTCLTAKKRLDSSHFFDVKTKKETAMPSLRKDEGQMYDVRRIYEGIKSTKEDRP